MKKQNFCVCTKFKNSLGNQPSSSISRVSDFQPKGLEFKSHSEQKNILVKIVVK